MIPAKGESNRLPLGTQSNYALRLPLPLKARAELAALKTADYFEQRARTGDLDAALAFLRRAGGQPPEADDRLPTT